MPARGRANEGTIPIKYPTASALTAAVFTPLEGRAQDILPAIDHAAIPSFFDLRLLGAGFIVAGLVLVIILLAVMLGRKSRAFARQARAQREENAALRAGLDRMEQVLDGPAQITLVLEGGGAHLYGRIASVTALPQQADRLLDWASWLDAEQAERLSAHMDALRGTGQWFSAEATTARGAPLLIEGSTAGTRLVVTIRPADGAAGAWQEGGGADRQAAAMRSLLENFKAPVWIKDETGRLEWANAAYARAVGASSAKLAVSQGQELLDSRARTQLNAALAEYDRIFDGEITGTDSLFHVSTVAHDGAVISLARNISEQHQEQARAIHRLKAQAHTLETVQTAIAIFGPARELLFFNKAFARLWDLDPDWLSAGPSDGQVLDALREAGRLPEQADYRSWKKKMLAEFSQQTRERMWHLPDGRTILVTAEPHPGGGATFFYDDVTENLRLESERNAIDKERRQTLENLNEGVALFSGDGVLRLSNPAFARMWKLNAGELKDGPHVDQIIAWSRLVMDETPLWSRFKAAITAMGEERAWDSMRFERPDGSVIDCAIVPLPGGATLVTYIDVTDAARAERALRERNEALEAADRVKNAFIQHVSYVLRAPLTTIIGYADLLSRESSGPRTEKQREFTEHLLTSSHSLLAIINDILDLATIDAGIMDLQLAPVDVNEVMSAAALGVRDRLQEASIELKIEEPGDIGTFVADDKRLKQILFNILTNAISHSPPGGTVTLRAARDGERVTLTVEDQGKGIAPEIQETIFKPFESHPAGSGHRGPGLGLSIVRALVELHGGDVSLRSSPGSGTTVTCVFPAAPGQRSLQGRSQDVEYGQDDVDTAVKGSPTGT